MQSGYLVFLSFFSYFSIGVYAQELNFQREGGIITLYENQIPRFSYQAKTRSIDGQYPRANYVHPLYSLNGEVLTEDFPADHLHQRGIFWSWHQLYVNQSRIGDPWLCEGLTWVVDTAIAKPMRTRLACVLWSIGCLIINRFRF